MINLLDNNYIFISSLVLLINFLLLFRIAFYYIGKGSDHYFYEFYIETHRRNGHRFFAKFPNFINETYITDPQFFFKLLSYFPSNYTKKISLLLNPILITLMGFTILLFSKYTLHYENYICIFILVSTLVTPHFFYGQNARIYGLNSRGIGLLLTVFYFICTYYIEYSNYQFFGIFFAILIAYLIWGVSLFAQQSMLFFSLLGAIIFGWYYLLVVQISGILLFYVLHRDYAHSYFIHRLKYLDIYNKYFKDSFLLKLRYSIWRDFIYDFWLFRKNGLKKQFLYIYYNGLLAVLILNPAILFFVYLLILNKNYLNTPIEIFNSKIIIIGFALFLLTSTRYTRILGEPERYLEMLIPFMNILLVPIIFEDFGLITMIWVVFAYLVLSLSQTIIFSYYLNKLPNPFNEMVNNVRDFINNSVTEPREVSFYTNNSNWANCMLNADWKFVHYYPTNYKLADIEVNELIEEYPFVKEEHVRTIQKFYNVEFVLIDKKRWSKIVFEWDPMKIVFENNDYIIYKRKQ
jgi:hypothetical protein